MEQNHCKKNLLKKKYSDYLIQQAYVDKQSSPEYITKDAFVEKILIDKHHKAYGVKFVYKKKHNFKAIARKDHWRIND